MIDLTPLDVRNKRGDFKKLMRGYDPHEVDAFLELAAERLEVLFRETLQLREKAQLLQNQVSAQLGREQAVQDALVTAQELRSDMRAQSQREADHVLTEAATEARRMLAEAEVEALGRFRDSERQSDRAIDTLRDVERRRDRFLKEFKGLLERELEVVRIEEQRTPIEERTHDLDLGRSPDKAVDISALEPESERLETSDRFPVAGAEEHPDVPKLETLPAEAGASATSVGREVIDPPSVPDPLEEKPRRR
jgi:cell division initiation protein